MEILIVNQREVAEFLPMGECMEAVAAALAELADGKAMLPLRSILWLPGKVGGFGLMPAALLPERVVGLKAITFFPGNEDKSGTGDARSTRMAALYVPAGTPKPIVHRLNDEAAKALSDPAVKERLLGLGLEPASSTPEQLGRLIESDRAKMIKVIKEANIHIEPEK